MNKRILLSALLVCSAIFFSACSTSQGQVVQSRTGAGIPGAATETAVAADTEAPANQEEEALSPSLKDLYAISSIDMQKEKIQLIRLSDQKSFRYGYQLGTEFLSKYQNMTSISGFAPGAVVEIQTTSDKKTLLKVQLSDKVWVNDDITKFQIDKDNSIFTIGETKYPMYDNMLIFSDDKRVAVDDIGSNDTLMVTGIEKKILAVTIKTGHGYVQLTNTDLFNGSYICIGDRIFATVTSEMKVEVPEGNYTVTVANNGWGGSKDITVARDESTVLDLNEMKGDGPKECTISFEIGVQGAALWIDNKPVDYSKPVKVQYGTHTIELAADGYETVDKTLVVNSEQATIQLALTATSDSDSGSDTTGTASGSAGTAKSSSSKAGTSTTTPSATAPSVSTPTVNAPTGASGSAASTGTSDTTEGGSATSGTSSTTGSGSSTDYLTTLYNLLNSLNQTNTEN